MIEVISGPFRQLSAEHQAAVVDLTTARFTRDLLDHDAYLVDVMGVAPRSDAFAAAREALIESFKQDLQATDNIADITVVCTYNRSRQPVALGAMRMVRGARADLALVDAVGRPDSSLQTHALLRGFRYPCLPGFDPYRLTEARLLEVRRWVSIDPADLHALVRAGVLTSVEEDYVLHFGTAEVCLGVHRLTARYHTRRNGQPHAGYLWTCAPRAAVILRHKMGLGMIPLFAEGCEPTERALAPDCFAAPLFVRHRHELLQAAPVNGTPIADDDRTRLALRHLATATSPHGVAARLSLPYLLLYDDDTFAKFDTLEDTLTVAEAMRGVRVIRQHCAMECVGEVRS